MKEQKVFAVVSMVMGILSMTVCLPAGIILGMIGLILGLVSFSRKEAGSGFAIAGIVTSVIGIALWLLLILFLLSSVAGSDKVQEYGETAEDIFADSAFCLEDDSVIYFKEDGSFIWYRTDDDHGDNYYQGTYEAKKGTAALDYIVEELPEYGVTKQEMRDFMSLNQESELYRKENYMYLALYVDELIVDGEQAAHEDIKRYMGFYLEGCYDAANMDHGEYVMFRKMDQ